MSDEGMTPMGDEALAHMRNMAEIALLSGTAVKTSGAPWLAIIARLDTLTATLATVTAERDRLYSLAKSNNDLVRMMMTERKALRDAASKAADQFGFYVTEHRAKGTPAAYAKAKTNEQMRDMLLAALTANHSAPVVEE